MRRLEAGLREEITERVEDFDDVVRDIIECKLAIYNSQFM